MSINDLNIFPYIEQSPIFESITVNNGGGSLKTGTYYIAIAYEDNVKTNYVSISKPVNILRSDTQSASFSGSEGDISSSKSISIGLKDLDTRYSQIRISLIHFANEVLVDVINLPLINFSNSVMSYTITGGENFTFGALEDIIISNPSYNTAKTLKFTDGALYLANLTTEVDLGFQKYANNIKSEAVYTLDGNASLSTKETVNAKIDGGGTTESFPLKQQSNNSSKNVNDVLIKKSFKRGEVYAFYISLILKDGTRTKAYHIPGRRAGKMLDSDGATYETDLVADSRLQSLTGNKGRNYQFEAMVHEPTGHKMAYWENQDETYPQVSLDEKGDFEVWNNTGKIDDLHTEKVRHHRIPTHYLRDNDSTFNDEAFFNAILSSGGGTLSHRFNYCGVKFTDLYFPPEIADKISGYEIFYAKKTDQNRLMLSQSVPFQTEIDSTEGTFTPSNLIVNEQVFQDRARGASIFHPFTLLNGFKDVSQINYLTIPYRLQNAQTPYWFTPRLDFNYEAENGALTETGEAWIHPYDRVNNYQYSYGSFWVRNSPISKRILPVTSKSYIPADTERVNIRGFGFEYDFNNDKGSDLLLLETAEKFLGDLYTDGGSFTQPHLVEMCSWKENVHSPYSSEELVSIYQSNSLNNSTEEIYNGDCYLNYYTYKHTLRGNTNEQRVHFVSIPCESTENIAWRNSGDRAEENFFPNVSFNSFIGGIGRDRTLTDHPNEIPNFIQYNRDYSKVNNIRQPGIYNFKNVEVSELPNTVIRSDNIIDREEFRIFRPDNRLDMDKSRGSITKLDKYQNILLIHCLRGLFRTKGKEQLETSADNVFVGSGDIFTIQPDELLITPNGFAGLQNPYQSIVTEYGYFFLDQQDKRVFLLYNELQELSSKQYGMSNLIRNGYSFGKVGYDNKYNRMLLNINDQTLSFSADIDGWVSFHDYSPEWYMSTLHDLFTIKGNEIWKQNIGKRGNFYNEDYPLKLEIISNPEPTLNKKAFRFSLIGDIKNNHESLNRLEGDFKIENSYQNSGLTPLIYFTEANGNYRRVGRQWQVNKFRDLLEDGKLKGNLEWYKQKQFSDKYHSLEITLRNNGNNLVYLTDLELNLKQENR